MEPLIFDDPNHKVYFTYCRFVKMSCQPCILFYFMLDIKINQMKWLKYMYMYIPTMTHTQWETDIQTYKHTHTNTHSHQAQAHANTSRISQHDYNQGVNRGDMPPSLLNWEDIISFVPPPPPPHTHTHTHTHTHFWGNFRQVLNFWGNNLLHTLCFFSIIK